MRRLVLAPIFIFAGACSEGGETDACHGPVSFVQQQLVEGTPELEYPAAEALGGQVVALVTFDEYNSRLRTFCSGTHFKTGWVLTARHCFEGIDPSRTSVTLTAAVGLPCAAHPVLNVEFHPTVDLAVVRIGDAPAVEPTNLANQLPEVGQLVALAGYGYDAAGENGRRLFALAEVTALEEEMLVVQATRGGACNGDSGGPLLLTIDGQASLGGVLSAGSYSCRGEDYYVSVKEHADWVNMHAR